MTVAIMAFLLLLATLVQSLVPAVAWLGTSKWPCLLGVSLYYALAHARGKAITVAILAGIIQDSLSLIPLGYSALCFTLVSLVLFRIREMIFRESLLTLAMVGALSSAMTTLFLYLMLALGSDWAGVPLMWLAVKAGGNALLGLVAAPAIWMLAGAMEHQVGILHSGRT